MTMIELPGVALRPMRMQSTPSSTAIAMIAIYMNGKHVGRTSERVLRELSSELESLRASTGKLLDAYSTTSLEPSHAWIVLDAVGEGHPKHSKDAQEFLSLLETAAQRGNTLLIEGE